MTVATRRRRRRPDYRTQAKAIQLQRRLEDQAPTVSPGRSAGRPTVQAVQTVAVIRRPDVDLLEWTAKHRPILAEGIPFDMDAHLYLADIYRDDARVKVVKKASQMGASEWAVNLSFWTCDIRHGNVFYVMPTIADVSDFSQMRLGPALDVSDYLAGLVVDAQSSPKRGTDRISMKRIRDRFIIFRHAKVDERGRARQLKSVPADLAIRDEVDEMDDRVPDIVRKRLGHSPLKEEVGISTPTWSGFGIDAEFEQSDHKVWMVPCPHCNHRQELTIDQVILELDGLGRPKDWNGKKDGDAWLACSKCGKQLDRLAPGEWVAKYPGRDISGYHLTRLFSEHTPVLYIVKQMNTTNDEKRREVWNQDLGLAYTATGSQLTETELDDCRRDYRHGPDRSVITFAGVDVGRVLHVVIRSAPDGNGVRRQLFAGDVPGFDDLALLLQRYRVKVAVIDALPETKSARAFQDSQPAGRVWLAWYDMAPEGNKKSDEVRWDRDQMNVHADRTRTLDSMFGLFYDEKNTLPADARDILDYYAHMVAQVRVTRETRRGTVAHYVNSKSDHFGHAENYCYIASMRYKHRPKGAPAKTHKLDL